MYSLLTVSSTQDWVVFPKGWFRDMQEQKITRWVQCALYMCNLSFVLKTWKKESSHNLLHFVQKHVHHLKGQPGDKTSIPNIWIISKQNATLELKDKNETLRKNPFVSLVSAESILIEMLENTFQRCCVTKISQDFSFIHEYSSLLKIPKRCTVKP